MTTDITHQWKTVVAQFNSIAPSYMAREPFPSIRRRMMAPILSEIRARGTTQTPRVNAIPENDLRACDPILYIGINSDPGSENFNYIQTQGTE